MAPKLSKIRGWHGRHACLFVWDQRHAHSSKLCWPAGCSGDEQRSWVDHGQHQLDELFNVQFSFLEVSVVCVQERSCLKPFLMPASGQGSNFFMTLLQGGTSGGVIASTLLSKPLSRSLLRAGHLGAVMATVMGPSTRHSRRHVGACLCRQTSFHRRLADAPGHVVCGGLWSRGRGVTSRPRRVVGTPEMLVGIPCLPHGRVRLVTMARRREQMMQIIRQPPKMLTSLPICLQTPPTAWKSTILAIGRQLQDIDVTTIRDGVVCHPSLQAGPGRRHSRASPTLTTSGLVLRSKNFSPSRAWRCTRKGRQASPRLTRVVTHGQLLWPGSTCGCPGQRAQERSCFGWKCTQRSASTSETSTVSQDVPANDAGLATRLSRIQSLAQSVTDFQHDPCSLLATQTLNPKTKNLKPECSLWG